MIEHVLNEHIAVMVGNLGDFGVFIAMFLESSIVPIPSEVILLGAGAMGIPLVSIMIFGALGSTLGAIVGYLLGRYAALPVILKFGKFILIKPHHIYKAEAFAKKFGAWGVLIGRVLPIVPFKVFSIASGITNIPLVPFIICTLVGVIPRILLLSFFGTKIMHYKKETLLIVFCVIAVFVALKVTRMIYNGNKDKEKKETILPEQDH
ncbi:MAG: DedA family protein [Candidatus Omnitrophica bacterium]|nr:DedA family protein [Candidatus Omnitrophota bacterium]